MPTPIAKKLLAFAKPGQDIPDDEDVPTPKKPAKSTGKDATPSKANPDPDGDGDDDTGPLEDMDPDELEEFLEGMTDQQVADEVAEHVDRGQVADEIDELMADYDPSHNEGVPEWVADKDLWMRCMHAVQPAGRGAKKYDDPYMVVASMYHVLSEVNGSEGGINEPDDEEDDSE